MKRKSRRGRQKQNWKRMDVKLTLQWYVVFALSF